MVFREIINWGLQTHQPPLAQRRIRLLNIISWVTVFLFALYTPVFLLIGEKLPIAFNLGGVAILLVIIFLNKYHFYKAARIAITVDFSLYFMFMALGFGKEVGVEYSIVALSILPILFFDDWIWIVSLSIFVMFTFLATKIGFYYFPPFFTNFFAKFDENYTNTLYFANAVVLFFIIFVMISAFKVELIAYQKTIEIKNTQLEQINSEIQAQNQTIQFSIQALNDKNHALSEAFQHIRDSVQYAQRIQNALLGNPETIQQYFSEAFIFFQPKDLVSGDFYWFSSIQTPTKNLKFVVVADCTGHGVPGAFMTVMGNNFLDEIVNAQNFTQPHEILYELDRKITHALKQENASDKVNDGMDLAVLVWDEQNAQVHFAGAKNPLYYVRQSQIFEVKPSKFPVGSYQYKSEKIFQTHTIPVEKGDVFYLFSDGFQDQFGGKENRKYLKKRFRELLLRLSVLSPNEQKERLSKEFNQWKGLAEQTDDVLVLGIMQY